jgi:hypothetical protein
MPLWTTTLPPPGATEVDDRPMSIDNRSWSNVATSGRARTPLLGTQAEIRPAQPFATPNIYSHLDATSDALMTDESPCSQNLLSQINSTGTAPTTIEVAAGSTLVAALAEQGSVSPPNPMTTDIPPTSSGTSNNALYKAVCNSHPEIGHLLRQQDEKWTNMMKKIMADQWAHRAESRAQEEEWRNIMARQKEEMQDFMVQCQASHAEANASLLTLENILSAASANMTAMVDVAVCPIRESLQTLKAQVTSSLDALEGEFTATAEALTKETCGVSSSYGHLFKTELPKLATKLEVNACLATLKACINMQPPPTAMDQIKLQHRLNPAWTNALLSNHASPIAHWPQRLTSIPENHPMMSPRALAMPTPPSVSAMHGSAF